MTAPIDLNLVRAFAAVLETGRFSTAGERLRVPRSTVSRAVAALEEQLGVTLFHRTTRTVSPTPAATALFERVGASLRSLEAGLQDVPESGKVPTGTLRVSTTPDIASALLSEVSARFIARYPATKIEFILTARLVDLVKENVDLALRITSTSKISGPTSLVARRIGRLVLALYASPSYLARRGTPRVPADLAAHDWIQLEGVTSLPLSRAQKTILVAPNARITSDDVTMVQKLVRSGAGMGWIPTFVVEDDVAEGRLVRVLPKWEAPTGSVHLVHPHRKHEPARVTAFRELLLESLRERPLR